MYLLLFLPCLINNLKENMFTWMVLFLFLKFELIFFKFIIQTEILPFMNSLNKIKAYLC
jgi:hypothetical protein